MTVPTSPREAREARRRRLQQRQTIIFGGLVTILLVLALISAAIWTDLLPSPFQRSFSQDEPSEAPIVTPCPPDGATPIDLGSITANVYNGTERSGLASQTAENLSRAGVLVNQETNWPQGEYGGSVQVVVGPLGVTAGYSLARLFPDSVVALESTREDETVDVVLGNEYESMLGPDEISNLDPDETLTGPEDCETVDLANEDG